MAGAGPEGLPWPEGDPGQVEEAAGRLRATATGVGNVAGHARELSHIESWTGPASATYHGAMGTHAAALEAGTGPIEAAVGPVRRLGEELGDAQREIRQMAREVREAEDAAGVARTRATTARTGWEADHPPSPLAPQAPPLGGMVPLSLLDAERDAVRLESEAAEVRRRAEQRAERLCDQVARADRRASGALDAAAGAAPGHSASPGAPGGGGPTGAPAVVARYAPVFMFHPDEQYLPADATEDWLTYLSQGKELPIGDPDWVGGEGQGAPVYYHYDRDSGRIDYWFWRRYNDFRNKGIQVHPGDWEGVSVQLGSDGRPSHVGYRQHGPISALPWDEARRVDGRPAVWPALGSAASYPKPGSYDEAEGPLNDLAGGKPGETNIEVDAGLNLQDADAQPWADEDQRFGSTPGWWPLGGSPTNPNDQSPEGRWQDHRPPEPADSVH